MTVLVPLFCLEEAAAVVEPGVVAAEVVVVGELSKAVSMAFDTPCVASWFSVRRVFLSSRLPGSSIGWK